MATTKTKSAVAPAPVAPKPAPPPPAPPKKTASLTEAQVLLGRFLEGGTKNLPVTTAQFEAMKDACRTPDILMEVVQGERYGGILRIDR